VLNEKKNRHYVQLIKSMTSLDCRRCNDISNLSKKNSKKIWASLFLSASVSILINTLIPATGFAEKKTRAPGVASPAFDS
jgi:hypothetical protein